VNSNITQPEQTAELRMRAEKIAREESPGSSEHVAAPSPDDTRNTLHELRVHQVELKMQNEELRRAQAELEATRARYFDLYNLAPVGYLTISPKGLIEETNLTAATLLGVSRDKLMRQPISRFILGEDQDRYYLFRKHLSETGRQQACELRIVRPDATFFWVDLVATPAKDGDGAPVFSVVLNDITERKRAGEALQRSEERHRAILQTTMDGYWMTDMQGRLREVNETYCRMSGYSVKELLTMRITDLEVDKTAEFIAAHRQQIMTQGEDRFESRHRRKNGSLFVVEISVQYRPIEGGSFVGFIRDITDRKRAEEALKERVKELHCLFGISALLESPKLSLDEILTKTVTLLPPAFQYPDMTGACIVSEGRSTQTEHFRETPWMLTSPVVVFGKTVGKLAVCYLGEKLTGDDEPFLIEEQQLLNAIAERIGHFMERKEAQEALLESEKRFRQAINATKDGLWEWDMRTNQEFFSPRFCQIIGYSPDDPALKHTFEEWVSRIHPDDRERVMGTLQHHLEKDSNYDVDYRHRHKSGEYRWHNSIGQAHFDEAGQPYRMVGCIRDITERKRSEETLRVLSSRLLTAQEEEQCRIAMELHDQTGQDLNVLKLHLASFQNRLRKDQANLKEEVGKILIFTDGIIEDVRRLAHGLSPSHLQVLGLCAALKAMIRNFSEKTGIPIQFDVDALDKAFPAETNIVLYRIFQEALTNIYKHARAKTVRIAVRRRSNALSIEIQDDGRGFDPCRYRMSEPDMDRGMGLSALELRAQMIGADLKLSSQPGHGTQINLLVPIKEKRSE
jgi:two-component system, NarL family, sensor histidine kinase UhpB